MHLEFYKFLFRDRSALAGEDHDVLKIDNSETKFIVSIVSSSQHIDHLGLHLEQVFQGQFLLPRDCQYFARSCKGGLRLKLC
jgi:hypothetical protein